MTCFRWSVLTYERLEPFTSPAPLKEAMTSSVVNDTSSDVMTSYHRVQPDDEKLRCEATVADHLAMMLDSNQHDQIISSAASVFTCCLATDHVIRVLMQGAL